MKLNKLNIALFALVIFALGGCESKDIYDNDFENKLFITGQSSFNNDIVIKAGVSEYTREITVGLAKKASQEIDVIFAAAPKLLDHYRQAYYAPEAELLLSEYYTIPVDKVQIKVGSVKSSPINIEFVDIDKLDRETIYVLPVTMQTVTGIEVLESARTMYYAFKAGALINVVADIEKNSCSVNWVNPAVVSSMTTITMEALVRARYFTRSGAEANILSIMGIEGGYLIRCGDANEPGQIQIATSSGNFPAKNAEKILDLDKWVHIALTHDLVGGDYVIYINGVAQSEGNKRFGTLNLARNDFYIGRSWNDNRWWPGEISEVRIWNRILTSEQINETNHFYTVNPAAEGLVSYWKFDEGVGESIKDKTANGNNLTATKTLKWTSITLPE